MSANPSGLDVRLAPFTTLRLGGAARRFVEVRDEGALIAAVAGADAAGEAVFVLGGGSNVVIADGGFSGLVVRILMRGISWGVPPHTPPMGEPSANAAHHRGGAGGNAPHVSPPQAQRLTAAAGEPWDALVALAVREGLAGIECLSGIPGQVGATPIQNVGAYGQEVGRVIHEVRAYDRDTREVITLPAAACGFGYRASRFKERPRFVVLSVTFTLGVGDVSGPILYPELARALGIAVGGTAPLQAVRDAVLQLRRSKGMVLDPADPDSVSVGSFFVNPVLDDAGVAALRERVRALGIEGPVPLFAAEGGRTKVSAAWLIERAGFAKGAGDGAIGLSRKHSLALVHRLDRPGGSTRALLAFAESIRREVRQRFGVTLEREPVLVGGDDDLGEPGFRPEPEGNAPDA